MVAEALLGLLLFGWLMTSAPLFWTVAVLAILLLPPLLATLLDLAHKPDDVVMDQHVAWVLDSAGHRFIGLLLTLAWLPHEAFYSLEAILRTLWRMVISRRRLLQWHPSSEVARAGGNQLGALVRFMWFGPALALVTAAVLSLQRPSALVVALPLLLSWFVSPALAWWASRPSRTVDVRLSAGQQQYLRRLARKTWAFFETFVGPGDNWLPPDNVQEQPVAVVAHRTSPTNMGLALLANLAARDFGYLGLGRLLERTTNTLLHHAAHGAPSRSFLQLVRHADAAAIGAALCFLGGQRQPGRAPADASRGPARPARRAAAVRAFPAKDFATRSTWSRAHPPARRRRRPCSSCVGHWRRWGVAFPIPLEMAARNLQAIARLAGGLLDDQDWLPSPEAAHGPRRWGVRSRMRWTTCCIMRPGWMLARRRPARIHFPA